MPLSIFTATVQYVLRSCSSRPRCRRRRPRRRRRSSPTCCRGRCRSGGRARRRARRPRPRRRRTPRPSSRRSRTDSTTPQSAQPCPRRGVAAGAGATGAQRAPTMRERQREREASAATTTVTVAMFIVHSSRCDVRGAVRRSRHCVGAQPRVRPPGAASITGSLPLPGTRAGTSPSEVRLDPLRASRSTTSRRAASRPRTTRRRRRRACRWSSSRTCSPPAD